MPDDVDGGMVLAGRGQDSDDGPGRRRCVGELRSPFGASGGGPGTINPHSAHVPDALTADGYSSSRSGRSHPGGAAMGHDPQRRC